MSARSGFFRDSNSKYSFVRLMSFFALIITILFGILTITLKDSRSEGLYFTLVFLTAAFAPKTVQKFTEQ